MKTDYGALIESEKFMTENPQNKSNLAARISKFFATTALFIWGATAITPRSNESSLVVSINSLDSQNFGNDTGDGGGSDAPLSDGVIVGIILGGVAAIASVVTGAIACRYKTTDKTESTVTKRPMLDKDNRPILDDKGEVLYENITNTKTDKETDGSEKLGENLANIGKAAVEGLTSILGAAKSSFVPESAHSLAPEATAAQSTAPDSKVVNKHKAEAHSDVSVANILNNSEIVEAIKEDLANGSDDGNRVVDAGLALLEVRLLMAMHNSNEFHAPVADQENSDVKIDIAGNEAPSES
jgi:hypothetical protein